MVEYTYSTNKDSVYHFQHLFYMVNSPLIDKVYLKFKIKIFK